MLGVAVSDQLKEGGSIDFRDQLAPQKLDVPYETI